MNPFASFRDVSKYSEKRTVSQFWLWTSTRALSGVLDLLALGLIWYTVDGVANGKFATLAVGEWVLLETTKVTEQSVALFGITALMLFVLRSLLSIFTLAKLRGVAVAFEMGLVRQILNNHLLNTLGGGSSGREVLPLVQHGINSSRAWVSGSVSAFSVLLVETFIAISLVLAMFVASPITTLFLVVILGFAALTMQRVISGKIRKEADKQRRATRSWITDLSGALSVRTQLRVRGKTNNWLDGIGNIVRESAESYAQTYFLNSLPRYVLETSALLVVSIVTGASFLFGDLSSNAAGAALILAGSFRISGALLPIQSALNRMISGQELGKATLESMTKTVDDIITPRLFKTIQFEVDKMLSSKSTKALCITGASGVGKTTALLCLIETMLPQDNQSPVIGFGGQDTAVIPGGLSRNISIDYASTNVPVDDRILSLAKTLGVEKELERFSTLPIQDLDSVSLSGGETTRLEFLRAHSNWPSIIFLDEPTTGLDPRTVNKVADFINSNSAHYVIVTHDATLISKLEGAKVIEFRE